MQAGGMPNSRDAGPKCYRKGGMQERRDSGPEGYSKGGTGCRQEGCRTAEMLDRSVTGKVGCRKGGVPGSIGQKLVQVMTTGRVYIFF